MVFAAFVVFGRIGVVMREWGVIIVSRDPKDTCCVVDVQYLQKAIKITSAINWELLDYII